MRPRSVPLIAGLQLNSSVGMETKEKTLMNRPRMAILAATGTARKRVIPAVRDEDVCTIVAIQARDPQKLAALASEFSVPHYFVDPEKMLDETKPDFAFIGSPPALHL